jgi:hypothetical protein
MLKIYFILNDNQETKLIGEFYITASHILFSW